MMDLSLKTFRYPHIIMSVFKPKFTNISITSFPHYFVQGKQKKTLKENLFFNVLGKLKMI